MEIIGYEGIYKIYENGDVENVKRKRILKPGTNRQGYLYVILYKDGKTTSTKIHRLIALHYIQNPDNKKCVDHIDRNRQNNSIDNLRWATYSENQLNSPIRGKSIYRGVYFYKPSNKWKAQIQIDGKKKYIGLYASEIEAAKAYNQFIDDNDMNVFYQANKNVFDI